jgi:class 3 adenylate cyclase
MKAVTVLFMDVVGSTSLAEQLDPEDIHAVMDGALEKLSAIVQAHHGKVLQYAGDNWTAKKQALDTGSSRCTAGTETPNRVFARN